MSVTSPDANNGPDQSQSQPHESSTSHGTSLAVWDLPQPAVAGEPFSVTVGLKCRAGCDLQGWPVVVTNVTGTEVGDARLGKTPVAGTSALYDATLRLRAPGAPGVHSWTAMSAERTGEPTHEAAMATFSFRVTARPDCRVELRVVAQETAAPVERVHVHLGCYQARTDSHGHARLDVAAGEYMLELWKTGFAPYAQKLRITNEVGPRVITLSAADDDPDTDQVWM